MERQNLDAATTLDLIRRSGGVPVLAHPGERTYSLYNPAKGRPIQGVPGMVDELKNHGLMGLECVYPYHEKIRIVDYFVDLARKKKMIVTGSRDFHGFTTHQQTHVLGTTAIDDGFLEQFQEAWG